LRHADPGRLLKRERTVDIVTGERVVEAHDFV
jgi:hypothetical protein